MANIDIMFSGEFLKAANLNGKDVTVTIASVQQEEVGGDQKWVVAFNGTEKRLVLNKTNANIIAEHYGRDTDAWAGNQITLYPTRTEFQGKIVDCIRVRMKADAPPPAAQPAAQPSLPPAATEDDDTVPF